MIPQSTMNFLSIIPTSYYVKMLAPLVGTAVIAYLVLKK